MWLLCPKHSCVDILHILVPVTGNCCFINDRFENIYVYIRIYNRYSIYNWQSFISGFFFLEESQFEKGCIKHKLIKQKSVQREQGEKINSDNIYISV